MQSTTARACLSCRKQKRKCTKEIPECSLCQKNGRRCVYSISDSPACHPDEPSDATRRLQSPAVMTQSDACFLTPPSTTRPPSLIAVDPAKIQFPALSFLDFEHFQRVKPLPPITSHRLPEKFARFCGQSKAHQVDVYFNSIHTFLPIVSKLRLYRELSASQDGLDADTALLLITMQLHTQSLDSVEPGDRELYSVAKACCSYLQGNNVLSIRLLQATLLIALYEISEALYPAAYRSRAPQMLQLPTSTELEERRRVWWAIVVLDRYVNIGGKGRPFACQDVRPDELLPVDDNHWDRGELALSQPLAVSTSSTVQVCPFGRTCQASHLLGHVLRHIGDRDSDAEFRHQEAFQLSRTLQALYATVVNESNLLFENMNDAIADLPLFLATALCHSALLSLCDWYCCTENCEAENMGDANLLEMQRIAIAGLKEKSDAVFEFSQHLRAVAELGGMLRMSPLVCDCLYQATANYLWYNSETGNPDYLPMAHAVKDVLATLGTRWNAARQYPGA